MEFASQGRETLGLVTTAMLAALPYAMVFMALRMPPGWDGIETTARSWEVDPYFQVVICTAYTDYSWENVLGRLGGSDRLLILKKPFDFSEVIQLAHTLTTKWSLQQESRRHADLLELELEMTERKLSKAALKFF